MVVMVGRKVISIVLFSIDVVRVVVFSMMSKVVFLKVR